MSEKINMENATANILLTVGNQVYAVAMDRDDLEAITYLIKRATKGLVPTNKSQFQFSDFLGLVKK